MLKLSSSSSSMQPPHSLQKLRKTPDARRPGGPISRCQRQQTGIGHHVLFIGIGGRGCARQATERKVKNRIRANVNNKMEAHEDIFA